MLSQNKESWAYVKKSLPNFFTLTNAACFVSKSKSYSWDIIKMQQLTIKLLVVVEGRGH